MSDTAPKEQPPLEDLQRALTISAFDIAHNDGHMTFQGCAELSNENVFRSKLPPPELSSTRVLILEAPFSIDNPGVRKGMPAWFNQLDDQKPRCKLDLWDLENLRAGREKHDPSRTFWTVNELVGERGTKPPGKSPIQKTPYLQAGYVPMGPLQSFRAHFWRYCVSVDANYTENGALELICRFPLIPEQYDMTAITRGRDIYTVFADPNTVLATPLKRGFLRWFLSEHSATRCCCYDIETSIMAIIMDLLIASVDCQTHSISSFKDRIPKEPQNLPVVKSPWVIHIATQARMLEEYVRHVEEYLAIDGKPPTDSLRDRQIKKLNLNIESRLAAMNLHLKYWIELVDLLVSNNAAYLDGVQAQSVKRLTLLATIFLPISLAASLLSMSTRAADLGNLWYDYFGLSVIALFLVSMGYFCMLVWDQTQRVEMRGLAPLAVILMGIRHVKRVRWRVLIPLFIFLFAVLTLASFVVGMVKGMSPGLHMLAYSAAATLGSLLILSFIDTASTIYTEVRKYPAFSTESTPAERVED